MTISRRRAFAALLLLSLVSTAALAQESVAPRSSSTLAIERKHSSMKRIDKDQIRELTMAVFADAGLSQDMMAAAGPVIDEVAQAEFQYQLGNVQGVSEDKIIKACNRIAKKVGAPEYAFIDDYDVKTVRARLATTEPTFIGHQPLSSPKARHARGHRTPLKDLRMSPLEAMHVTATLLLQKTENPAFLMTSAERSQSVALDVHRAPHLGKQKKVDRVAEMHRVVANARQSLSPADVFDLSVQTLQAYGVGSAGGAQ